MRVFNQVRINYMDGWGREQDRAVHNVDDLLIRSQDDGRLFLFSREGDFQLQLDVAYLRTVDEYGLCYRGVTDNQDRVQVTITRKGIYS